MVKTSSKKKMVETTKEVAAYFGVTPRTVRDWRARDDYPFNPEGPYCIVDIAEWRFRTLDLRSVEEVGSPESEIRRRKLIADMRVSEEDAKAKSLKNRQTEKELVSRIAVKRAVNRMFTYVRQMLEAYPSRVATRFPEETRSDNINDFQRFMNIELRKLASRADNFESEIE